MGYKFVNDCHIRMSCLAGERQASSEQSSPHSNLCTSVSNLSAKMTNCCPWSSNSLFFLDYYKLKQWAPFYFLGKWETFCRSNNFALSALLPMWKLICVNLLLTWRCIHAKKQPGRQLLDSLSSCWHFNYTSGWISGMKGISPGSTAPSPARTMFPLFAA